jgi:hypothetical protein
MAADTMGIFREMLFVKSVDVLVSRGRISEYAGTRSTSSYVRASKRNLEVSSDIANNYD